MKNLILLIALLSLISKTSQYYLNKTILIETLSVLNLNGLNVDFIESRTFEDLYFLKKLYLNDNMLSSIDALHFKGLNNLEELWLESNNINSFDQNALNGMTNLRRLCIYNNPISKYYPDKLKNVCTNNPKCVIYFNEPCNKNSESTRVSTTKSSSTTAYTSDSTSFNTNLIKGIILLNFFAIIILKSFFIQK